MKDVYEMCPVLENEKYLLRLVQLEDAKDLLKVYSDQKAVTYFNSDNCHGELFFYNTLRQMEDAIKYWIGEYERKGFARWAIVDKESHETIGTIELFHRNANDYFNDCGLLRLDLRSDYERKEYIHKILVLIIPLAYELFECSMVATKAEPFAVERISVLQSMKFSLSQEKLIGHDGSEYGDYWVCLK